MMNAKINRSIIGVIAVCSLFAAILAVYHDYLDFNTSTFAIEMESSAAGPSQVFYDTGRGYRERESYSLPVQPGEFHKYFFPMTGRSIKSIRFDPLNLSATVRIREATIQNHQGAVIKKIPLRDFRAVQQITAMDVRNGILRIDIAKNADDPILAVENSSVNMKINPKAYWSKRWWLIIGCILFCLLIPVAIHYFLIFASRDGQVLHTILTRRELLLAALLGLWGIVLLAIVPPFQVPDEFAHYDRAYQVSQFTFMSSKKGDLSGGVLPSVLRRDQTKFQTLPFSAETKISYSRFLDLRSESPVLSPENLTAGEFYYFPNSVMYPPVPYLFSASGIAFARFFSMTVLDSFYMARLFDLLAVITMIWGAMLLLRCMPELQLMVFLIAGMPMAMFELMSVSADSITIGFAILTFAFVANLSLKWNYRIYAGFVICCVLLGLCKQTYALLPCAGFIFWENIPGSFFRKAGHVALVMACALVPMTLWSISVQSVYVTPLKGAHIDPPAQLHYFMSHWEVLIPYFLKSLFYENIFSHGVEMYGCLGWLDTPLPGRNAAAYFGLCLASVLVVYRGKDLSPDLKIGKGCHLRLTSAGRSFLISFVFILVLAVALSLYLSWNAVGADSLQGIQGRYFIPLLPFLLLAVHRLVPLQLTRPYYLCWVMFCLGAWIYLSVQAVTILGARYWIA